MRFFLNPVFFGFFLGVSILSCTGKKRSDFIKQACVQGNPNCVAPTVQIGTSGSDSDQSGVTVGNGENINNSIKIKNIRYGDTATLEFILYNSTLNPLHDMTVQMNPGDVAFKVIAGVSELTCTEGYFYYSQKCAVGIQFTLNEENSVNGTLPANQTVRFIFKTLTGGEFVFEAVIKPSDLIPDLYIAAADLDFPNLLIYDSGQACSYTQDLTVYNYGTEKDITDMHYSLQGDSAFSIQTTTGYCSDGGTLAKSGGNCKLKICYKPTEVGTRVATLVMTGSNATIRQYNLFGNGLASNSSVTVFDFGSMVAGTATSTSKALTIIMPTDAQATSAANCSYSLTGSAQFSVVSNTCLATPAAGSSCVVTIQYSAASSDQIDKGQFKSTCTQRGGNIILSLSGVSSTRPLVADAVQIDFGEVLVGETTSATIGFQNVGTSGALTGFSTPLSAVSGTGISTSTSSCSTSLNQGASCSVVLNFTPTESGSVISQFGANANESSLGRNISIEGKAIVLVPSQTLVEFGVLENGKDRPGPIVTILNPAKNKSMTGCSLDASTLAAQGFTLDTDSSCLSTTNLAASTSCTLIPRFTAKTPEGLHSAQMTMNCGVGGATSIALTGYVSNELRLVAVPPTSVNFEKRLVGITQEIEFLFENQHATDTASTLSIASTLPTSWSFVTAVNSISDCRSTGSLAPGDNCGVRLRFAPSATAGSEAAGITTGTITASADSGSIDAIDPVYSANAVKVTASTLSYDFGVLSTADADGISVDTINISNPSTVDAASGCALSLTNTADFAFYNETCGSLLLPGANCSFQIKAKSNGRTSSTNASGYAYYTCAVGGRASLALSAQIKRPPQVTWTPSTLSYGTYDIVYTTGATFTLAHTGTLLDSSVQSLMVTTTGTIFSISSNNCPSVLAPGASCNVGVNFFTATEGTFTSNLVANSSPDNLSVIAILTGVAVAPRVTPNVNSIDFGTVGLNKTRSSSAVTLTNTSFLADDSGCNITTSTYYSLVDNNCGSNFALAKRATCDFKVQFDGRSSIGNYNGTAFIDCADPGPLVSIPLTTEVLNTANITMGSTPSTDFGYQDYLLSGEERTYTLTNEQGLVVSISTFGLSADSSSSFTKTGGTCDGVTNFGIGASCTVKIKFNPSTDTSATGESATLVMGTEAFNPGSHSDFVFTGKGSAMSLVLSTATLDFADREVGQGTYESLSANLTNNGTRTASLNYSSIANPPFTSAGNCTGSLAAGATCTLTYQFAAAVTPAIHDTSLVITEAQNTSAPTLTLLAQTFAVPSLSIKDNLDNTSYVTSIGTTYITGATIGHIRNIIDFVATPSPNPIADVTYTIKYTPGGSGSSSPISVGTLYGYLNYVSNAPNTMSVISDSCSNSTLNSSSTTCNFTVRYTPISNNEYSYYKMQNIPFVSAVSGLTTATLSIDSIYGRSTRSVNLSISQATLDFGPITAGTYQIKSFTIKNNGDQTALNLAYSVLGTAGAGIFTTPVPTATPTPGYCGSSLVGQEECTFELKYTSASPSAFQDLFSVSGVSAGANRSLVLRGASYNDVMLNGTVNEDGHEADIVSSGTLFYVVSKKDEGISGFNPILNICDKSPTTGELLYSTCQKTNLASAAAITTGTNLAGNWDGSGPRIIASGGTIAVLVQNMDINNYGENSSGGNAALFICNVLGKKQLTSGDCIKKDIHYDLALSGYGRYGSLAFNNGKIIISNQSQSAASTAMVVVACNFSTSAVLGSVISGCNESFIGSNPAQGNHTNLNFDGSKIYLTAYNNSSANEALMGIVCNLESDNSLTCGNLTILDSDRRGANHLPGSFPSAYYDNNRLYIAYQSGSTGYMKLRLTTATISSGTNISVSSTVLVSNVSGSGSSPRMVASGNSNNGRLWISSCLLEFDNVNNNRCRLEFYKCNLLNGVASCSSTPYFQQPEYLGEGVIYSRSLFIDSISNMLIAPYRYYLNSNVYMNSVINLGVLPGY